MEGTADTSGMISAARMATLARVDIATVEKWICEDPAFPRPVAHLSTGDL
jgi:hypothetical protein